MKTGQRFTADCPLPTIHIFTINGHGVGTTPVYENAAAVSGGGGRSAATPGMKPSWRAPVCRVCLAKPETNSCARPRKAGQRENPQADLVDLRVSVSSDELPGSAFVRPNEARHIQTAFPAFAKRPGTPPPPENVIPPGLLV
jgi:hypothetical protein